MRVVRWFGGPVVPWSRKCGRTRWASACAGSLLIAAGCLAGPVDSSGSAAKTVWIRYDDPAEHAFSFEAPQGWEVKGGMYRFGYFDVRWMVDVRSPDNQIILRINDASIPPYVPPGPHTPPEGQPLDKPKQFQMVVETYRDGKSFAETYARQRFKNICQNLTAQPADWKPSLPDLYRETKPANETEGFIAYRCSTAGGPRVASVYARTSLYHGANDSSFWLADPVISSIAAPDEVASAQAVAQHMINSFQKNPQWVQYQKTMEGAGLRDLENNFQTFMSQMQQYHQSRTKAWNQQVAGYQARENASQAQSASWGDTITGLTAARDPITGESFKVWTGPNANYYINGLGNKVNSNLSPGSTYRQLETAPK